MADKNISDLPAASTIAMTDLLELLHNPSGVKQNQKMTLTQLRDTLISPTNTIGKDGSGTVLIVTGSGTGNYSLSIPGAWTFNMNGSNGSWGIADAGGNTLGVDSSGVLNYGYNVNFDGQLVVSGTLNIEDGAIVSDGGGGLVMSGGLHAGAITCDSNFTFTAPATITGSSGEGFSMNMGQLNFGDGSGNVLMFHGDGSADFVMTGLLSITGAVTVGGDLRVVAALRDGAASAGSSGFVLTSTGTATAWAASKTVGAVKGLFDHFADAGNTTTGETDLFSDTIAAGQLATNGDKLYAHYSGLFVQSATATRTMRVYFAGTKIFDSGALTTNIGSAAWSVEVNVIRVSSTTVRTDVTVSADGVSTTVSTAYTSIGSLTLANTQVLKITGQAGGTGAATNDIVAKIGVVQWVSAA